MKITTSTRAVLALGSLCAGLLATTTPAATLYWDPDGTQPTSGGGGTWTGNVWYDGSAYVAGATVAPFDDYVVSAGNGTITRSSNVNLNSLRISVGGYTIGGNGWLIINSAAAGAFTVDPGLTLTIATRMFYGSGTLSLVVGTGSTVTYDTNQLLGTTTQGATLSGGGTLIVKGGGGFRPSSSVGASKISGSGTTLFAEMDHPVQNASGYLSVESQCTFDLNNRLQGDISGATWSGLLGLAVTGSGSRFLGGGTASRLVVIARSGGTSTDMGKLSVLSSGSLDTEGGWVGVFTTNADDSDLVVSGGGSIVLGGGKLVLGYINSGTGSDTRTLALALSGGGSISGAGAMMDLTRNNTAAKIRTITVANDVTGTDFTIAAGIADGNQAGSGIIKAGPGTLLLSGDNTFTGTCAVNAGTLQLTGSLATSKLVIASGATLNGSGTIKVTSGDVIDVNGELDLSSGLRFDLSGFGAGPVTVADYAGATLTGFSSARVTTGWRLSTVGSQIVASKLVEGTCVLVR